MSGEYFAHWMKKAAAERTQNSKTSERLSAEHQQNLEVRSHVLTLREGELDSRLCDCDRMIDDLKLRLRELTAMLRKEQATRESVVHQLSEQQSSRARPPRPPQRRLPPRKKRNLRKATKKKSQKGRKNRS
jgi:hypothetical protein